MHRRFSNAEEIIRGLATKITMKSVASYDVKDRPCNLCEPNKVDNRLYLFKDKHREYYITHKVEHKVCKINCISNT